MNNTTFNHLQRVKRQFRELANTHNSGHIYFEEYLARKKEIQKGNSYQRLPQKYRESAHNYEHALWERYIDYYIYVHVYRTARGPVIFLEYNDIMKTEGEFNQEYYVAGFNIHRQWLMSGKIRSHRMEEKPFESLPVSGLEAWKEKQVQKFLNGKI